MGRPWRNWSPRARNPRDDALANMDPYAFERVVADHYRREGYEVEHCGGRGRYDGGIDLKMHRDGEYVIVQCKRMNAYQVTHNVGHELLGVMLTENADRAVVVNAGEFTRHARESAAREPRLELIDGDRLREMLPEYAQAAAGREPEPVADDDKYAFSVPVEARAPAREPMLMPRTKVPPSKARRGRPTALDRDLRKRPTRRRGRQSEGTRAVMALAMLAGVVVWQCSKEPAPSGLSLIDRFSEAAPVRSVPSTRSVDSHPRTDALSRADRSSGLPVVSKPARPKRTPEESRRRADEAMRILAPNTPEFEPLPSIRARQAEDQ